MSLKIFGEEFQIKLLNQVITNIKSKDDDVGFGEKIINELNINHFDNILSKEITKILKDNFNKNKIILDVEHINYSVTSSKNISKRLKKQISSFLDEIINSYNGIDYNVREIYLDFLNTIYLDKCIEILKEAKDSGDINKLEKINSFVKEMNNKRTTKNSTWQDLFTDAEDIFSENYRKTITLNCGEWLDTNLGGGISKGDLIYVMMKKGFGKTTFGSRVASGFLKNNYKVAHIVWEDRPEQVKAKLFASLCNEQISNLKNLNFNNIIEKFRPLLKDKYRIRRVGKNTTVNKIEIMIDELCREGFVPDLLIIDYVKKLKPIKTYENSWGGGGEVMEELEELISPTNYNIACIALDQVNRSGYDQEIIDGKSTSGDISKIETAHAVISFTGDKIQKVNKKANVSIVHSRFGDDNIIKKDIIFDNSKVFIDTGEY